VTIYLWTIGLRPGFLLKTLTLIERDLENRMGEGISQMC